MSSFSMPRRIENPVTGDRIEFLSSPLFGDSGPLIFRCALAPLSQGSPPHLHRTIVETFEVERGLLEMEIGAPGVRRALFAGEAVHLEAGTVHGFRNAISEPTVFVSTATPGAQFEKFLRAMYGLAADGRTDASGMPTDPRALALTLHYADLVIPAAPRALQRMVIGALAGLARLTRLERDFERYWPTGAAGLAIAEAA